MAVMSLIASLAVIAIVVWLLFHLIGSIIKVIIITIILIALAYFVFGWNFGLGSMLGMVMGHTDVSTEGVTVSFFDKTETVNVTRVIDGDTVEISTGEKVRLIGINAPESGEPCSQESKARLQELVLDNEVTLKSDTEKVDDYDRLLSYIYVGNDFVNEILVEEGLAHAYEYGENIKFSDDFEIAETKSKQENGCLWKSNSEYNDCISVLEFNFDAEGNDNNNLNDEYIIFENTCDDLDMTDWTLKDESASNKFTFSSFTAPEEFTIYSGTGDKSETELYWGRTQAVWNNDGDTLFLRDKAGELVLTENYEVEE